MQRSTSKRGKARRLGGHRYEFNPFKFSPKFNPLKSKPFKFKPFTTLTLVQLTSKIIPHWFQEICLQNRGCVSKGVNKKTDKNHDGVKYWHETCDMRII